MFIIGKVVRADKSAVRAINRRLRVNMIKEKDSSRYAQAEFQRRIDFAHLFGRDIATATEKARFLDSHDLLAFHVGLCRQTILFCRQNANVQGQLTFGPAHRGYNR
jgi:hypothetical protein